jgi:phosphotriesterase-related protein
MATIETVTGAIDAGALGTTLIHEHLMTRDEAVHAQWPHAGTTKESAPHRVEPGGELGVAIEAARGLVERGVRSIADPSAMFLGRDVSFMRRVAEETGLQVVACTGVYTYDPLPMFLQTRSPDQIAELFVHDIETGIQGTEIKAAFIKCAADEPGVTENVEKIHRAAARASVQTQTPIMAHTRPASETGPRQIEIFEEEGVDLSSVQMAHTGDTDDLDYIQRLLDKGVFIGMDRYGLEIFLPFEKRQQTVLTLLERGREQQMFLSADACATLDWYPADVVEQMMGAGMARDWNSNIVPDTVLPGLREAGMTAEQEQTMMVDNAVAWLTGERG